MENLNSDRFCDPALSNDPESEQNQTLDYFQTHQMLQVTGQTVHLNKTAILSAPPVDVGYRKKNPVKFAVNQILHLPDVVQALETVVLND